jgi:hypothetical protein
MNATQPGEIPQTLSNGCIFVDGDQVTYFIPRISVGTGNPIGNKTVGFLIDSVTGSSIVAISGWTGKGRPGQVLPNGKYTRLVLRLCDWPKFPFKLPSHVWDYGKKASRPEVRGRFCGKISCSAIRLSIFLFPSPNSSFSQPCREASDAILGSTAADTVSRN